MTELKPCPFCEGKVKIALVAYDEFEEFYYIHGEREKGMCQCRLFMESEKFKNGQGNKERNDLVYKWNRRGSDEQVQKILP